MGLPGGTDGMMEQGNVVPYCGTARGQDGPYVTIPTAGVSMEPHQLGPLSLVSPPHIFMALSTPCPGTETN